MLSKFVNKTMVYFRLWVIRSARVVRRREIDSEDGNKRIVMKVIEDPRNIECRSVIAIIFYSLELEKRVDGLWKRVVKLSDRKFRRKFRNESWICDLMEYDFNSGYATIKVGEKIPMVQKGSFKAEYSHRIWDIVSNTEIRTLKKWEFPTGPRRYRLKSPRSPDEMQ